MIVMSDPPWFAGRESKWPISPNEHVRAALRRPYNCHMCLDRRWILDKPGSGNLYWPIIVGRQKRADYFVWQPILKCDDKASVFKVRWNGTARD